MKALILSANTGGGHNSCAKAIQDVFISQNEVCNIQDCLSLISKGVSETTAFGHIFIYRHAPWIVHATYKNEIKKGEKLFKRTSLLSKALALGVPKLYELIEENDYDTIICTHIFAAQMITALQDKYKIHLLTAQITTDYGCSANSKDTDIDFYFIPDKNLIDTFVNIGLPEEKILASGIPVKKEFFEKTNKEEEKEKLGIPKNLKHLLVMGGSMGGGPIPKATQLLIENLKEDNYLSVVCGTNKALYDKLSKKYGNRPNVHIYEVSNQMPLLMHSADLLFTKPGGLTTTEAYACNLPMALLNYLGGCETDNKIFFTKTGGAIAEDKPKELVAQTIALLNDPPRLKEMSNALAIASQGKQIPEIFIYDTLKKAHSKAFLTSQE